MPVTDEILRLILKVEGDRLLMQDPTGKEVSLRLTKDTKFEGVAKEGDQVRVEFTPDREGPSRPDRWLDPAVAGRSRI